jgi:hypothetical protein
MSRAVAIAVLVSCERDEPASPGPSPGPPAGLSWEPVAHPDSDRDGWVDSDDCAPHDAAVHPEAVERCNGLDDDCDGTGDADLDGDGALWCDDCDDGDADVRPGAPDSMGDHVDQDCDGTDGVGLALGAPLVGPAEDAWYGFALASGDLDGDGCDELVIGQPGIVTVPYNELDSVTVSSGCWPWSSTTVLTGDHDLRGYMVDTADELILMHDYGYRSGYGRILLFDAVTFRAGGDPVLDVLGDDAWMIHAAALLGEGPEWLIWGRQGSFEPNRTHYRMLSLPREGVVDLDQQGTDHLIQTDSGSFVDGGHVADIGDRDSDGNVDLGFGQQWDGDNAIYFFPAVTSGHITDAPEVWRKDSGTIFDTRFQVTGDADLDGDGADDALVADSNAHVEPVLNAGRVYLVPWRGAGEHSLPGEAPARIDGEREWDWTGIGVAAGDLDGDGQDDLVVGAPGSWDSVSRPGQVMVFPGPLSGVHTRTDAAAVWVGTRLDDHAGYALALGDLDGSGKLDLAIGAPHADVGGIDQIGGVFVLVDPM